MAAKWEHGVPVKTHLAVSGVYSLQQPIFGDIIYRLLLADDAMIEVEVGKAAERQSMTVVIQQPLDGGCEVAWPSGVKWQEGRAPLSIAAPQPSQSPRSRGLTILTYSSGGLDFEQRCQNPDDGFYQ